MLPLALGHSSPVHAVAVSPNGQVLATGGSDATIVIWDVETGIEQRCLEGHEDSVYCLAFSPDGQRLFSGSKDETAQLWDAHTGQERQTFHLGGEVRSVEFSADGRLLLTATRSAGAVVWNAKSGARRQVFRPGFALGAARFTPEADRVVLYGESSSVLLQTVATGEREREFYGHLGGVTAAAVSPDGMWLATADSDLLRVWELETAELVAEWKGHEDWVTDLSFSANSKQLASVSKDGTYKLWRASRWGKGWELHEPESFAYAIRFSPDGRRVVAGLSDGTAQIWDARTGKPLHRLKGLARPVWSVAVAEQPDKGPTLLATSSGNGVMLWPLEGAEPPRWVECGRSLRIRSVALAPDGAAVAAVSRDKAYLIDTATGKRKARLRASEEFTHAAVTSDGERFLLSDSPSWVLDGETFRPLARPDLAASTIAHTEKGRTLVANARLVVEAASGETIRRFLPLSKEGLLSEDGRLLATCGEDAAIWDVRSGEERAHFELDEELFGALAMTRDGRQLVIGLRDGFLIWDHGANYYLRYCGHRAGQASARFICDERALVTAGWDGATRIWDLESRACIASLIHLESGGWLVVDDKERYDTNDRREAAAMWPLGTRARYRAGLLQETIKELRERRPAERYLAVG